MDPRSAQYGGKEQAGLEVAPSQDPIAKGPEYPDLQVAPSDAPIVDKADYSDLEVAKHLKDERYNGEQGPNVPVSDPQKKPRRICGLRVVTFWLALALSIVILVGAVGGGVGGGLASSSSNNDQASPVRYSVICPWKQFA